jgi:imidazolonepropionase-like amidohydrolase
MADHSGMVQPIGDLRATHVYTVDGIRRALDAGVAGPSNRVPRAAIGTDLLLSPDKTFMQNVMLTRRAKVDSNVEVLKIARYGSAALFARAASAISYKEAKPGVLQEGAWADMLLVEGDPPLHVGCSTHVAASSVSSRRLPSQHQTRGGNQPDVLAMVP